MAKFIFIVRGEGFPHFVRTEFCRSSHFADLLRRTPEQLLEGSQFERLQTFLADNAPVDRWKAERKREGMALAALVRASNRDALIPEVKALLCQHLEGKLPRKRGRPKKPGGGSRHDMPLLAKFVKEHVELCISEGRPLEIPAFGAVEEQAEWRKVPPSERAMRIAHKMLRDRGYNPPSIRTLRNKLPKESTLGIIV